MRKSKLFIERPLEEKKSEDLLPLHSKQCRLATGMLMGHCTLRQYLNIMGFSDNIMCRICGGGILMLQP
jgi:hypothetical protein